MFIVALTGGIGSGKSAAAEQFALLGVPIVDTDAIAHHLTSKGSPVLMQISQTFGTDFLTQDGSLNRSKLRLHIFGDTEERFKLEALLHPAIYSYVLEKLNENERNLKPIYQIVVLPLLFENPRYDALINKIVVIDCDEAKQINRAMTRSKLSEVQVKAIMESQVKREIRLNRADEVIVNNGSIEELHVNVINIHEKFIKTCVVRK